MDKAPKVMMTQDGVKKLKRELDLLKTKERKKIALEIQKAMEFGDLSENAAYSTAVEKRDLNESRIVELEQTLENVEIISNAVPKSGKIGVGSKVKFKFKGLEVEWTVVGAHEGDPSQGLISIDTPIGSALIGKKVGDIVKVDLPSETVVYEILSIK
jgi:transcription elongation factor GreA